MVILKDQSWIIPWAFLLIVILTFYTWVSMRFYIFRTKLELQVILAELNKIWVSEWRHWLFFNYTAKMLLVFLEKLWNFTEMYSTLRFVSSPKGGNFKFQGHTFISWHFHEYLTKQNGHVYWIMLCHKFLVI